jgi:hypothetical protein
VQAFAAASLLVASSPATRLLDQNVGGALVTAMFVFVAALGFAYLVSDDVLRQMLRAHTRALTWSRT